MIIYLWTGWFRPSKKDFRKTQPEFYATVSWDPDLVSPDGDGQAMLNAHLGPVDARGVPHPKLIGYRAVRNRRRRAEDALVDLIDERARALNFEKSRGGFTEWSIRNKNLRAAAAKELTEWRHNKSWTDGGADVRNSIVHVDYEMRREQETLDRGIFAPYFLSTTLLTREEAARVMTLHCGPINNFQPEALLKLPLFALVRVGREYSPVIYVDMPTVATDVWLKNIKKDLLADEASLHQVNPSGRATYRFWWD